MRDLSLWAGALALWVIGDLATTAIGLRLGAVERSPVAAAALANAGVLGLVPLKLLACGLCGALYGLARMVRRPWARGVPLGLILLGSALTVHNATVILGVI